MSIDNNTRQFYLSMGYSESQIAKAIEQSQRLGIDVLDALNLPPQAQVAAGVPDIPVKQHPVPPAPQPVNYPKQHSFLTPWKIIKQNDYEIFFSKTNKHQQSGVKIELR